MSSGSKKPQRRFQFIDNTNVSSMGVNSTQVRRHVMQEYMREKRWEARSQPNTTEESHPLSRKKPDKARSQPRPTERRVKKRTSLVGGSLGTQNRTSSYAIPRDKGERQSEADESVEEVVRDIPDLAEELRNSKPAFHLGSSAFAKLAKMMPKSPF